MSRPIKSSQSKFENLAVALLLAAYVALAVGHAALAPLTTGPDELAHYEYVNFIAEHGRLPLTGPERAQASYKSDQPPLFHLLAALPAGWVNIDGPSLLKRYSDHPRRQLIERTRHAWGLHNTLDEQWPWRGEVLRWQVGRWAAILFGVGTVLVTYRLARELFGGSRWMFALAAAAVVAFVPRWLLTGSMLNYETTVAFFSALFLWTLLRVANNQFTDDATGGFLLPTPYSLLPFTLGLFAGLAIVSKLSAVILPLEIVLAFWWVGRARSISWRVWGRRLALAALGTLIPVSIWFGFVVAQFNTVAQDGWWAGLLRPLIAADASDATTNQLLSLLTGGQAGFTGAIENLDSGPPSEWAATFFRTFWVAGIEGVTPLGNAGLAIVLGLCAVAATGLLVLWLEMERSPQSSGRKPADELPQATRNTFYGPHINRLIISLLFLHLFLPIVLPLVRYAVTFSLADTAQGRHVLFMAAPAFAVLLVLGLSASAQTIVSSRTRSDGARAAQVVAFVPGLFLFGWSLVQLWTMSWAYLLPLPVTVQAGRLPPLEQRAERSLTPVATLLGYQTRLNPDTRLLAVDVWWRSDAVSPVDEITRLDLLDAAGQSQAVWLGHPADGRYPTRAWDPGDLVRQTMVLPVGGLPAGDYHLSLQLRPTAAQFPPEAASDPLSLGPVSLPESTLQIFESQFPLPQLGALAGYTAWQGEVPVTSARPFRYRETISVALPPPPPNSERRLQMVTVTPGEERRFDPVLLTGTQAIFLVGPDWPSGDYHLQLTLTGAGGSAQTVNGPTVARITNRWQRQFTEPPISRRTDANFANQVELLGYDLAANRAAPGGGIPLTLYWRGLDWLGEDYTIFTKLIKSDDRSVHGGRDRLPHEGYRTLYWAPGEVVTDPFGVPVDTGAPGGMYIINLGLYRQVNGQAVSLPLVQNGQLTDVTSLDIGPVKIGAAPPGLTLPAANPDTPTNLLLGEQIELLGFDGPIIPITNEQLSMNNEKTTNSPNSINLMLYWRAARLPDADYTTFVHLRNTAGETVAQKDQPPGGGAYPSSLWDAGEIIADEIAIALPPDLPPGQYTVVTGLYNFRTGQRLAVPGNPANEVELTGVTVR